MKTITIRMNDELHKKLKLKMAHDEKTIQDHVIQLLEKDLGGNKEDKEEINNG